MPCTRRHQEMVQDHKAHKVQQAQTESAAQFVDWRTLAEGGWSPAAELPAGIRRGEYAIDLDRWEHAIPGDMRLAPRATQLTLPSVAMFPCWRQLSP